MSGDYIKHAARERAIYTGESHQVAVQCTHNLPHGLASPDAHSVDRQLLEPQILDADRYLRTCGSHVEASAQRRCPREPTIWFSLSLTATKSLPGSRLSSLLATRALPV